MTPKTARVLITDSDSRSALAATRALGAAGHEVFTAGEAHPSLASVSRFSKAFEAYPSPNRDPQSFVKAVADACAKHRIDVVVPTTEITTLLLTQHQTLLPAHTRLPFAGADIVARAADKSKVLALAESIGVPIPKTIVIGSVAEAESVADRASYPAVVKASRSRILTGSGWLSTSVSYAHTREELVALLKSQRAETFPLLVQERIEGPGVGVFLCCDESGPIASFAHRRIREKPPSGGVSVLAESTAPDPLALDYATRLLQQMQWRGVAMVEFKRDLRDGSLRLMEINGRFWGSLQLAIDAGVNFPALLVDLALGTRPSSPPIYKIGVRTRWWWGDVDSLLSVLFRNSKVLNLPPSHPGRWATLLSFLKLWQSNTRYELERFSDFKPSWLESRRWLTNSKR